MFEGVVSTDWHLTKLARLFPNRDIAIQFHEVEKPYAYIAENGLRRHYITGDITNKPDMDDEYLIPLIGLLAKYDKHVETVYIPGNHDFREKGSSSVDVLRKLAEMRAFKNLRIVNSIDEEEVDGVRLVYSPYPYTEYPEGDPAIVFAHVEYAGAVGDNGRVLKSACDKHSLQLHPGDVLVSGHLHTHQYMHIKKENRRVLFTGAPYQTNFGEQGPKGFCHIKARTKNGVLRFQYEHINSKPSFSLINLKIEDRSDWDKIENDPNKLYKIVLGEGVVEPKNLLRNFPNVVSLNGNFKNGFVDHETVSKAVDMPKITPLTGLVSYLKNTDLSRSEMKQIVGLAKEAAQELGLVAA